MRHTRKGYSQCKINGVTLLLTRAIPMISKRKPKSLILLKRGLSESLRELIPQREMKRNHQALKRPI